MEFLSHLSGDSGSHRFVGIGFFECQTHVQKELMQLLVEPHTLWVEPMGRLNISSPLHALFSFPCNIRCLRM